MRNLKKIISVLLAFVMCVVILGACGDTSSDSEESAASARAAEREAKKKEREEKRAAAKEGSSSDENDSSTDKTDDTTTSDEPEMILVYSENQIDGYPTVIGAYKFKEVVEEETNGRIQIDVRPNSQVGTEDEVIQMLQNGAEFEGNRVAFSRTSLAPLITYSGYEKLNVLQLPYLYKSKEHMRAVLNSDIGEVFLNELADNNTGIRGLSWFDSGARNFYNSKHEIKTAADLQGLVVRVQTSDMMLRMAELLGATAVSLDYEKVPSALESGEIDCAENNWPSYVSQEHHKYAPYLCTDEHTRIPEMIIMSDEIWNELSESDQDIIKRAAQLAAETEWDEWAKAEEEYENQAKEEGCIITEIDDNSSFQNAVKPLYEEFAADYMDVVEEIQNYQEY